MSIRVVDNKKLDMTNDEWNLYQKIIKSYATPQINDGSFLFNDLFETNNDGAIVFLKPPSKQQTSMEVFLFLVSLMVHQHLRASEKAVADICQEMKSKMSEIDAKLNKLSKGK